MFDGRKRRRWLEISEPCSCEKQEAILRNAHRDAIGSFVASVVAGTAVQRRLDAATARLRAVAALCTLATVTGRDVPVTDIRAAMKPTEGAAHA